MSVSQSFRLSRLTQFPLATVSHVLQIAAVLQTTARDDSVAFIPNGGTGFTKPFSPAITGDYNHDGVVDAADYSVWRDTLGSTSSLAADGNNNHVIDSGDYTIWKTNFGNRGSGAASDISVPEPAAWTNCFGLAIAVLAIGCRRRRTAG